jgi:hypothetical protein
MTLCLALHAKQDRQFIGQLSAPVLIKRRPDTFGLPFGPEGHDLVE